MGSHPLKLTSLLLAALIAATPAFSATKPPADPKPGPTVYLDMVSGGHCSGIYLGGNRLLTASHCVAIDAVKDGQAKLAGNDTIRNAAGEDIATARDVIVYSKSDDLAVLRLSDPLPNTPASIDCTRAHVGQEISIVGSPGQLGFVTTWGRVAAEQRKWDQWDAVIVLQGLADAGNSGGPVFDTATGKVVGVLVAGVTPRDSLYYLAVPATSICYLLGL